MKQVLCLCTLIVLTYVFVGCGPVTTPQWVADFEREVQANIQARQGLNGFTTFFVNTDGAVIPETQFVPTDITDVEWKVALDEYNDLTQIHVSIETTKVRANGLQVEIQTSIYSVVSAVPIEGTTWFLLASQEDLQESYQNFSPKIQVLQIAAEDLSNEDQQISGRIQEVPSSVLGRIKGFLNGNIENVTLLTGGPTISTQAFFKLQYQNVNLALAETLSQSEGTEFNEDIIPTTTSYVTILLDGTGPGTRSIIGESGLFNGPGVNNPIIQTQSEAIYGNK